LSPLRSVCAPQCLMSHRIGMLQQCGGEGMGDQSEACFGKVQYSDGSIYQGQLLDGQRHGRGVYTYSREGEAGEADEHYDGEWQYGLMHGSGKYVLSKEFSYDGEWARGLRNGKGVYTACGEGTCEGIWEDGKFVQCPCMRSTCPQLPAANVSMRSTCPQRPAAEVQRAANLERAANMEPIANVEPIANTKPVANMKPVANTSICTKCTVRSPRGK